MGATIWKEVLGREGVVVGLTLLSQQQLALSLLYPNPFLLDRLPGRLRKTLVAALL